MAPVLPDAEIDPFDPTTEGSPAVGDGAGLAASPDEVVASFAESVRFPEPGDSKLLVADPLTEQLRQSAQAQSQALNKQGRSRRPTRPRTSSAAAPQGRQGRGRLRPPRAPRRHRDAHRAEADSRKELTRLTGIKQITSEASLTSNEIIAIVIPRQRAVPGRRGLGPDRRRLGPVRQD